MRNTLVYDTTTYDDDALRTVEMDIDTSLNSRELDVDTIRAVVDIARAETPGYLISSDDYYLVTSDGFTLMADVGTNAPDALPQNTPIRFLRGGSQYSLWFRDVVRRIGPTTYELSMVSSLGRLSQMAHVGGIYNGVDAEDIIDEICGVIPHYVDPVFAQTKLYGWLPYVSPSGESGVMQGSAKDNLLQVLFALNATVRDDANGTLRIENLSTAVSSIIDADKIYRGNAAVEYETPITEVTVIEHQYAEGSETETLFDGTTMAGQVIVFSEPMSNLSATGFTITDSGANYAVVSAGTGVLTGSPYIHTKREITRSVSVAPVPNAARIEDATLVGITNSSDVADRLADYYAYRTRINVDAIVEFEDAGDVVSIYDPYDKVMRSATIESIYGINASNVMRGSISAIVGFTPWQVEPFIDQVVMLTGSGTWTVPEGVTRISAVLIGGGTGGGVGNDGGAMPRYSPTQEVEKSGSGTNARTKTTFRVAYDNIKPIAGGASGAPGAGGNIYRMDLEVTEGDTISYACGTGGAGAIRNGADAVAGTDSTFGAYSSASGSQSPSGYTDPVSGNVYGNAGAAGFKGGDGGGVGDNVWDYIPAGSVTDGVNTWTGGADNTSFASDSGGSVSSGYGYYAGQARGGFGGGAAYGSNGGDALGSPEVMIYTNNGIPYIARATCGRGGNGANALPPPQTTVYGRGGTGGNGGGAVGQWHYAWSQQDKRDSLPSPASRPVILNFAGGTYSDTTPPTPGTGSDGGQGGDGCILLYYREPA